MTPNRPRINFWLLIILNTVLLTLFVRIIDGVLENEFSNFDTPIIQSLYVLRNPNLTQIMLGISQFGNSVVIGLMIFISLILLFYKKYNETILFLLITGGGAVLSQFIKLIIARPRPTIDPMVIERTFAFPSGHAMNSLIMYGIIVLGVYYFTKKISWTLLAAVPLIALILAIGFSRIYLGLHYPSDVLGGYLAGLWWLITLITISQWNQFKTSQK